MDPAEWAALVKAVYISAVIIYALLEMIQVRLLYSHTHKDESHKKNLKSTA